ncbi:MAG: ABC transporter substrate-binding protein [Eubacteriales bacterium]|nr:ABC transporter substrate-binding protein [Eubacteriales bacterium]
MKKVLAVVLVALMVLSLGACGKTESNMTVQKGKLIIATNAAFPPYEFIADDGKSFAGIDIEISEMIAKELGLELEVQDMEFASILTAVQTGKADVAIAALTVTEERKQNVNFSSTYATGIQSVIVKADGDVKSIDDLANVDKIGVQEATTGHIYCEGDYGEDHIIAYSNGAQAVQALIAGKVQCVVIDNSPAKEFVAANEGLTLLDSAYAEEDYAAAFSKNSEELLKKFNEVLDKKIADGSVQKILDKYIKAE